eukprot:NODE_681_length_1267_cov_37.701754_g642_i0.p1 GENE.NODE_681_length_1267_cov_37.701754_g642_i0~~NODE_681_length_1267_cov_37.701754_g642_i0.p1  ORF type:complete len:331 (-),score=51.22 NODE_681_length_1267_cov_37.701754_g642_i0:206-1198(-)
MFSRGLPCKLSVVWGGDIAPGQTLSLNIFREYMGANTDSAEVMMTKVAATNQPLVSASRGGSNMDAVIASLPAADVPVWQHYKVPFAVKAWAEQTVPTLIDADYNPEPVVVNNYGTYTGVLRVWGTGTIRALRRWCPNAEHVAESAGVLLSNGAWFQTQMKAVQEEFRAAAMRAAAQRDAVVAAPPAPSHPPAYTVPPPPAGSVPTEPISAAAAVSAEPWSAATPSEPAASSAFRPRPEPAQPAPEPATVTTTWPSWSTPAAPSQSPAWVPQPAAPSSNQPQSIIDAHFTRRLPPPSSATTPGTAAPGTRPTPTAIGISPPTVFQQSPPR